MIKDPRWVLDSEPRLVQIEALRRSYGGFSLYDGKDADPHLRQLPLQPRGWSHYLEMRLGKTPLALNEFELFRADKGVRAMVAICPSTFRQGWVDEAEKSGASVPWEVYESNKVHLAEKLAKSTGNEFGIAINYEALKTDKCMKFLEEVFKTPTALYIDESIKIKNPTSQQTKAVLAHSKRAAYVRNLSGLPMTQGPQDLYAQFRSIGFAEGLNYFTFRAMFCKMGGFKNKKIVGSKNEEKLKEWLDRTSFVAKRKNWASVLVPEYYQENLGMTPTQAKHYKEMDNQFITMLENGLVVSVDVAVSCMMKLQQISSGFLYHDGEAHYFEDPRKLPKTLKLLDIIEESPGKVIVCYHYGASGDLLMEVLKEYNPAVIRGKQWMMKNSKNLDTEKKRFNLDSSCKVMVLQIGAGKYGHDLSGHPDMRCGTMVFYENTFSLDDRTQIEQRNTTAFQDWANTYHDFVSSGVERNAVKALADKSDLVAAIIGHYRGDPDV